MDNGRMIFPKEKGFKYGAMENLMKGHSKRE